MDSRAPAPRILIVDDTPANVQVVAAILKEQGYQLSVATNGLQALAVVQRIRPDLILLDVVMPEMDGLETCARLKAELSTREIPIIFLTAQVETDALVRGFEAGAVDYVGKPFNSHELLARVATHLTIDQLRRDLAAKHAELERAHRLVRQAFGRYVSEEVADSLLSTPEALELGGEEREATILMSDLRGFTALTERLAPQLVLEVLNLYLQEMVEVITRHQGTIDEIIGDAILVIFGAPLAFADHAARAVACGLEMQLAMTEVNRRLVAQGRPHLQMGIGVHSGPVIVGNIGSLRRTKYAAVGSTVSLAGRIESFTVGGQLLISEATRQRIGAALRIDDEMDVEPKGARATLRLFEVGGIGPPYCLDLPSQERPVTALPMPLPVSFFVLEEKFAGRTQHQGSLTALSATDAVLEAAFEPPRLSNLKLEIAAGPAGNPGGELYAKVLRTVTRPGTSRLRLTSTDPGFEAWASSLAPSDVASR